MCFHFLYIVQVDTVYQKVLYNSCLFLLLRHGASLCFTQKNNFCIMNKIKLVWFYSLYRNLFFLIKNVIFLYILKIFFTMLHLKIFLEYWVTVYFQNIVVCNERFIQKSFLGAKNVIFLYILKIFFTVLG